MAEKRTNELRGEDLAPIRELCLRSTYAFGKFVCGFHDFDAELHQKMSAWVERPSRFKLGQAPRGFLKTSTWTIADKLRRVTADPNKRVLLTNEVEGNTAKWILLMQDIVMSPTYRALYPDRVPDPLKVRWNTRQLELRREAKWPEPTVEGIGVGGASTSNHYDIIVNDDLVGKEARESPLVMEKAIDQRKLCWSLLVDASKSEIHDFGTRWAPHDVIDWIQKNVENVDQCFVDIEDDQGVPTWPTRYPREVIEQLRKEQGAEMFCTPRETPILMADWTFKPIADVQIGDEVMGWKDLGGRPQKRLFSLIATTVEAISIGKDIVQTMTTEAGRKIRCTPNHRWLSDWIKIGEKHHPVQQYAPAKIGSDLRFVVDPRNNDCDPSLREEAAWLSGLFDGEGTVSKERPDIRIAQSIAVNADVCAKISHVLPRLGFGYATYAVNNKTPEAGESYFFRGGIRTLARFSNVVKPTKWAARIREHLRGPIDHWIKEHDHVVSIEPGEEETVYGLQTGTGNYVAWGFASSNSLQYRNRVVGGGASKFDPALLRYWDTTTDHEGKAAFVLETQTGLKRVKFEDCHFFQVIDAGLSPESKNARTANVVCAITPPTPTEPFDIIIVEAKATKSTPYEVVSEAHETYRKWQPMFAGIETFGGHEAFFHWIAATYPEMRIRQLEKNFSRGAKHKRIIAFWGSYPSQGRVYIHRSQTDLVDELVSYDNGPTVDLLDAAGYMPTIWVPPQLAKEKRKLPPGVDAFDLADNLDDRDFAGPGQNEGRSWLTGY